MDFNIVSQLAGLISDNILTPVIYVRETECFTEFICFCDRHITMQEIYDVESKIEDITGKKAEITDIREYGESERIDVINNSSLIYSEHPLIEKVFARSMIDDYKIAMAERKGI